MLLRVSGKNIDIGESLQEHVREKVGAAIAKYFDREASGHVTIQPDGSGFRSDLVLHLPAGITLQAEGHGHDPYATMNQAVERLEKRLRRHKQRIKDRHAAHKGRSEEASRADEIAQNYRIEAPADEELASDFNATVVAEGKVALRQMSVSAAVMELDMSGVPVLVFRHSQSDALNVVYRRADGHIGWIDPSKSAGGLAERP